MASQRKFPLLASEIEFKPRELNVPHQPHHFLTKKILLLLLVFLLLACFSIFGVLYLTKNSQAIKPGSMNERAALTLPVNVSNFPIYPNATFQSSKKYDFCGEEVPGYSHCGTTTYTWVTSEDGDKVNDWYKNDIDATGWDCLNAGAGEYSNSRSFSFWSGCTYKNTTYRLVLQADEKQTTITLGIPEKN